RLGRAVVRGDRRGAGRPHGHGPLADSPRACPREPGALHRELRLPRGERMNEIETIREFRSDVPYPDAATTARARAALMDGVRPAPRRRARLRWPFALAATAAAAAAAVTIVVVQSGAPSSAA